MASNPLIWIGMFIGSTIGGLIPGLWGAGSFSLSSVIFTAVGGFAGIWLGLKISKY
jgi:hypothetical protein